VTNETPERDAVRALRQAVEIEPGFVRAWRRLAWVYMSLRWDAGTQEERREANVHGRLAASRYSELAPEDPDAWVTLGLFVFDPDEAGPYFQRATQLDANNSGVMEMRLLLLIKSGRGKEALALAEQALVLDPLRWGIVWRRMFAAMISERFDVAEAAIRGMDPGGAVRFWPAVIMARLARGEPTEAQAALQELEAAISAFERTAPATDLRKTGARLMRGRFEELSEVLAALEEGDADSRRALAARLFVRASDPGESEPGYAYLVELPAISLLDGVDRAFEAWDRRLDLLPSYDAEHPTSDHRSDVFSLQDVGHLPGFRLLHRDPRFWSLLARYDPRVFVVPTGPHARPQLQEVVDRIWDGLWPPDFCRAQDFPYDCDAVASAAFADTGHERQMSVATDGAE
jgi:tetratricopeptide (TPR) repeat protein